MSLTLNDWRVSPPLPLTRQNGLRLLGGLGLCGLVALWAASFLEPKPELVAVAPVSEPLWQPQAEGLFTLSSEVGTARSTGRQRRDGARQDLLVMGEDFAAKSYVRLVLHRAGPQDAAPASFYLDVARMAALAGIAVTRSQLPQAVPTRFGQMEVAGLTLTQAGDDRACTGFRLLVSEPDLRLTGLACAADLVREPQSLACFIERLEVDAARADPPLATFFAKAHLARSSACVVSQTHVRNLERPSRIIPASR